MVELSVQLEVELNVATVNEVFAENKVHILEKELKQAQDRIKERDEWSKKLDEIIDRKTERIILLNEIRHEAGVQDANLREKLSEANNRIKQLKNAGNNLANIIGPPHEITWATETEIADAYNLWIKVNEDNS
jgi:chromosome segregation ATPase